MATGNFARRAVFYELTAMGLRTRRGRAMAYPSFSNLLQNPIYTGPVVVAKWNVSMPGDFEPLVSEETFATVQAVLSGRWPDVLNRRRDHPDFPLRRFVRCGKSDTPSDRQVVEGQIPSRGSP
jgi:hypothetical protein